jgi:hypothetical protein
MDRTPIGKKFIGELIKVNDQLCYSALVHHELESSILSHSHHRFKGLKIHALKPGEKL